MKFFVNWPPAGCSPVRILQINVSILSQFSEFMIVWYRKL